MDREQGSQDITELLLACRGGGRTALDELISVLDKELHRIAKHYMAAQPAGHTLQTTALVNEAYLRLVAARQVNWRDRSHFLAACSQTMRRILVDHARARAAAKRGGPVPALSFAEAWVAAAEPDTDVVALNEALDVLESVDARKAMVVELRFFGGLSPDETALVLGISRQTVMRDWRLARAWLARELREEPSHGSRAVGKD